MVDIDAAADDGEADVDAVAPGNQPEGDTTKTDVEGISGGSGDDTLTGTTAANALLGGPGEDVLNGGAGDDALCGDQSASISQAAVVSTPLFNCTQFSSYGTHPTSGDTLSGGDGNDVLAGNAGSDVLNGGNDNDTASYADKYGPVAASINATANDGMVDHDTATPGNQPENDLVQTNVENLVGSGYADTLTGTTGANALYGGTGADTLNASAGNDLLDAGDLMGDVLNGGTGFDYAAFGSPNFQYSGVTVTLNGAADDGPSFAVKTANVKADIEGVLGSNGGGDTITGQSTAVANTFVGYAGGDMLDGKTGDDSLTGGAGTDNLLGDAGNDLLHFVDGGFDSGDCGAGTGDRALVDDSLDAPSNCETLTPVTASSVSRSVADPRSAAFRKLERAAARSAALTRRPSAKQRRAVRAMQRAAAAARR